MQSGSSNDGYLKKKLEANKCMNLGLGYVYPCALFYKGHEQYRSGPIPNPQQCYFCKPSFWNSLSLVSCRIQHST